MDRNLIGLSATLACTFSQPIVSNRMSKLLPLLLCLLPGALSADRDELRLLKSWGMLENERGEMQFALPQRDGDQPERWVPDLSVYQAPVEAMPRKTLAPVVLSPASSGAKTE